MPLTIRPAAVALVLAVGVLTPSALALRDLGATYYVSPGGRDDSPGTQSRPFRSIQRAADVVNPGDSVVVEDGTYAGFGEQTPCAAGSARPVVCLTRSGTAQAWITFRARTPGGAKVDGRPGASTDGFVFASHVGYIRLDGFDVFGMGNANQSGSAFELYAGGHDVVMSRNRIHDIGRLCTDTPNGQSGIFVAQPRVLITQNVIHTIGRYAPGESGCAPKTGNYRNHDHGIYVNGRTPPGGSDVTISNNIFHGHRRGWPIHVYPGTSTNLAILNNTFVDENPFNIGHILIAASTVNGRIINNLFSGPMNAALNFYGGRHANLVVANNLSSVALASSTPQQVVIMGNFERVDGRIYPSHFRLRPDSPAIDGGQRLPEVAEDIDGVRRPQGRTWDIGASEAIQLNPRRVFGHASLFSY